jgi:two-component system chemotaxis response regulator CheY
VLRILVAEDDYTSRMFLSKFLEQYGSCDTAADGLSAIDACMTALEEGAPYDLICLDIMLPRVDGVKVLRAIRDMENQYRIPPDKRAKVIITTALAEAQFVRRAFDYGCEVYASKPIDLRRIAGLMEDWGWLKMKAPAERM